MVLIICCCNVSDVERVESNGDLVGNLMPSFISFDWVKVLFTVVDRALILGKCTSH